MKVPEKLDILHRLDMGLPKERLMRIFVPRDDNERKLAYKINEILYYLDEKIYKQRNVKGSIPTEEIGRKTKE